MQLSLIFFGSDIYSTTALQHIIDNQSTAKIDNITIITDRPKPVGKDRTLTLSQVENIAIRQNLKVSYYPNNPDEKIIFINLLENTKKAGKMLGLCASFDHLIPTDIISIFAGDLYNLHPSLLPQYRNVSPVQYAIALGDTTTGITLFRISPSIDDGEIIAQAQEPILPDDTTPTLTPRLFKKGAYLFLQMIQGSELCLPTHKNKVPNLVFTKRLKKDSGFVEWPALQKLLNDQPITADDTQNELLLLRLTNNPQGLILSDLLRALTPWPGVWSLVPTKKGELRITLISNSGSLIPDILIAGKPNPINISDFTRYYF